MAEPEISEFGIRSCHQVGQWLKTHGVKLDMICTSAHKRAVLSAIKVLQGLEQEVPLHLMLSIHECGGVFKDKEVFPGLTRD